MWATLLLLAADGPSQLAASPKGWVDIMPGADLKGWTRVPIKSELRPEVAVWKVDPKARVLRCSGELPPPTGSHELFRYDKDLGDFVFHVEWRFVDPARTGWNSGVFARTNANATIWHQAQTGNAAGGFWFGDTPDETGKVGRKKIDAGEKRVRPAGEWNAFEITARGDRLTLWVNGAVTAEWTGILVPRGHIGLEAEGHPVEFRNLKLKTLK